MTVDAKISVYELVLADNVVFQIRVESTDVDTIELSANWRLVDEHMRNMSEAFCAKQAEARKFIYQLIVFWKNFCKFEKNLERDWSIDQALDIIKEYNPEFVSMIEI